MKIKHFVFVVVLVLTGLNPVSSFAYSGAGAGTVNDPFIINNCVQLQEMNDSLSSSYALATSMDCSDTYGWNGWQGFGQIGSLATPFTGTFDGAGYTIDHLHINRPENNQGLFGYTVGATIHDVHLGGTVQGLINVGALVGYAQGTTISKVSSNMTVGGGDNVGGLVGVLVASTVENSYSTSTVVGSATSGGLVGYLNSSTLYHVYAAGAVPSMPTVGGLIGFTTGSNSFTESFWDTDVSGTVVACGDGSGSCSGITGKTTTEMKSQDTFDPVTENTYGFPLSDYAKYRYVKWEITRIKFGGDTNCYTGDVCTQASEFKLLVDGFPLSFEGISISNPDGINHPSTPISNLIDDNVGTKFLDAAYSYSNNSDGLTTVVLDAGSGQKFIFNGYNWATGNDQNYRDPVSWTLSGSDDDVTYTVIDTKSSFSTTENRDTFLGTFNSDWNFYSIWGINSADHSGYPFLQEQGYGYTYNAPEIVSLSPAGDSIDVPVNTPIVITFSEPMDTSSFVYGTSPCAITCAVYDVTWSNNNKTVTLVRSDHNFDGATTYTIQIDAISDTSGTALPDVVQWSFKTIAPWTITSSGRNPEIVAEVKVDRIIVAAKTELPIERVLKIGMSGDDVKALQVYLNTHSYFVTTSGQETNYFGGKTKKSVQKFQKDHGLKSDGVVGKKTRSLMI